MIHQVGMESYEKREREIEQTLSDVVEQDLLFSNISKDSIIDGGQWCCMIYAVHPT